MGATLQIVKTPDENTDGAVEKNFDASPEYGFEDFYALYPKHQARKDALKAWGQLDAEGKHAALVGVVEWRRVWQHEASRREDFLQYLPLPATWLRGERFHDELPAAFRRAVVVARSEAPEQPRERQPLPDHVRAAIEKIRGPRR